jgi:hypothetical protein
MVPFPPASLVRERLAGESDFLGQNLQYAERQAWLRAHQAHELFARQHADFRAFQRFGRQRVRLRPYHSGHAQQ